MNALRKQCQKDLYELSKLTLIPAHSNRILRQLDISRYESMKPSKIVDMVLNIASTSNQQEIENFTMKSFSDYKYYWQLIIDEIENIFNVDERKHCFDTKIISDYLIDQGYRLNPKYTK